jgi:predicted nucleic acid-binding protein
VNYRPVYLDTSALARLVFDEAESEALLEWLGAWPDRVASQLAAVEMSRLLARARATTAAKRRATRVLAAIVQLRIDEPVLALASTLRDPLLRSRDAIHLASALSLGDVPEAFVTYDQRLADAAARLKLTVVAPA